MKLLNKNSNYFNAASCEYYGQGVVSRSIGVYFRPLKEKALMLKRVMIHEGYKFPTLFRRTTKSMKEPVSLKGWKGKR